jgi:small subunit ribosomal protein S20
MAITTSAKKAHRASRRKRVFNIRTKVSLKEGTKAVRKAITAGTADEAMKLMSAAQKALDKAAKRGVISKNAASRTKSRLTKSIVKLAK